LALRYRARVLGAPRERDRQFTKQVRRRLSDQVPSGEVVAVAFGSGGRFGGYEAGVRDLAFGSQQKKMRSSAGNLCI
jgi:hypothetical protein